ncbi:MAG TPA: hypothetical protein VHC49_09465 [Mycobacteriales bacterium]|nr:hypothetical protein [Mycobacteriales bacterium]
MSEADRVPSGVNRRLWLEALELADGDGRRIEIRSATSLIVHNSADWTPAPAVAVPPPAARPASPPTPQWTSAGPARSRPHTKGRAKSDVPAFLAPASNG